MHTLYKVIVKKKKRNKIKIKEKMKKKVCVYLYKMKLYYTWKKFILEEVWSRRDGWINGIL